jgi:transglutaminase-like putative cysteine protease
VRYKIIHRTTYTYESPVTVCHYTARLEPRALPFQECPWHEITIRPEPVQRAERADYFGNTSIYFEIEGSHQKLEVIARSLVEVEPSVAIDPSATPVWESVRDMCRSDQFNSYSLAGELTYASPLIPVGIVYAEYARPSFPAKRPVLEAVCDLNRRIHEDFLFDPSATDFATPVEEVLKKKRGVCQDFAQVMIACIRSLGLPARYVSGYLETLPPPGQVKLVGADASHAWVSVFCGESIGWMDADPTNNILPSDRHITVAWGRDFSDVSPLRGVTIGAGEQRLQVAVDVLPESDG